jgi:hypothetical protein
VLASGPGHGWPSGLPEGWRCVEVLQCWAFGSRTQQTNSSVGCSEEYFIVEEVDYKHDVVDAGGSKPVAAGRSLFVNKVVSR